MPPPATDKPAQYVTANNDTLWEIAAKVRTAGTVQQTMLAIQALNPDAFIGGNINRLKKGQVLRLPSPQQTTALPQPQAVTEVSRQYTEWRGGRRSPATGTRQVDATRRDRAGAAPSSVDKSDNLSLVSANGKPAAKGAAGDDVGNKLAVAQEALDTTRRDNAELKSRMNDLQSQLDKLQRLIELKNGQLAKMQAAGAAVPPAAAVPDTTTPANAAVPASLVDANGVPIKPPGEVAPEDALPAGAAQVATPAADQPLAVEPVAAPEEDDTLQKVLDNPVLLGLIGGAALLILALLLLFLARRRAAKAEAEKHKRMARALAEESEFVSDMDLDTPQASFDGLDVPPPNVRMGAAGAAAAAAATRERQADPLVQAEIHIAYGRMNQAVELLEEAVQEDPKRDDIRLKLMEIYAEQGNNKAYAAHERKLVAAGKPEAEVEQLEERNSTLKPAAPLASEPAAAPSAAPAVAAAAVAASAAALAAELDARYVEELLADPADKPEEQVAAPEPQATPLVTEPVVEADEFDHDFDLSLDEFEETTTPEVSTVNDLDDLTLDEPKPDAPITAAVPDEELTFESIMQQQEEARAAASTEELADFDLDLSEEDPALKNEDDFLLGLGDDSLDLGKTTPPVSDDLELPEDFDLSLADEIETDQASQAFASEIDDVNAELDRLAQNLEHPPLDEPRFTAEDAAALDDEPDFDFMSGTDEAATKLDLARAYIDMGDADGARDILDEVVTEGDEGQKTEAREMLSRLA